MKEYRKATSYRPLRIPKQHSTSDEFKKSQEELGTK
jgi:hypothetical protein